MLNTVYLNITLPQDASYLTRKPNKRHEKMEDMEDIRDSKVAFWISSSLDLADALAVAGAPVTP